METLTGSSGVIALFSLLAILTLIPLRARTTYIAAALAVLTAATLLHGIAGIVLVGLAGPAVLLAVMGLSLIISLGLIAASQRAGALPLQLLYSASLLIPAHIFMIGSHFLTPDNPVAITAAVWFVAVAVLHARTLTAFLRSYFPARTAALTAWAASLSALALACI